MDSLVEQATGEHPYETLVNTCTKLLASRAAER